MCLNVRQNKKQENPGFLRNDYTRKQKKTK
jgi:hypothetical protein